MLPVVTKVVREGSVIRISGRALSLRPGRGAARARARSGRCGDARAAGNAAPGGADRRHVPRRVRLAAHAAAAVAGYA